MTCSLTSCLFLQLWKFLFRENVYFYRELNSFFVVSCKLLRYMYWSLQKKLQNVCQQVMYFCRNMLATSYTHETPNNHFIV